MSSSINFDLPGGTQAPVPNGKIVPGEAAASQASLRTHPGQSGPTPVPVFGSGGVKITQPSR